MYGPAVGGLSTPARPLAWTAIDHTPDDGPADTIIRQTAGMCGVDAVIQKVMLLPGAVPSAWRIQASGHSFELFDNLLNLRAKP